MGRAGARPSALNIGQGPQTAGLVDPLGIWGPSATYFDFDLGAITLTPNMAKRDGQAAFRGAIMGPQGRWDGSGAPDVITFPRGAQLGNPTERLYANYDPYQGSIVFWLTPEWDGDDGLDHNIILPCTTGIQYLVKHSSNVLRAYYGGGVAEVDVSAWTAGTTYFVVFRWDSKRTLDGANHCCWSINNAHTFGRTSYTADEEPLVTIPFGVSAAYTNASNALIEGFTVYRRPLTANDGTGVDVGNTPGSDEITEIYAAGAGADPMTITNGSWDIPFCLPTDSTPGALVTGPGEAWSHPLESGSIGTNMLADDGGYLGGPYAVVFNGTTTSINCGSDVDIDDIMDDEATVEAWIRPEDSGEGGWGRIAVKDAGAVGWRFFVSSVGLQAVVVCATTNAAAVISDLPLDGKWHHVTMHWDDANVGVARVISLAVDGVWATTYATQTPGEGAIDSDVAVDLIIGNRSDGANTFDGDIGWVAISNNDRHTVGTDFIAPRDFPADDANYLASWPMNEGTGVAIDNIGNQGGAGSGAANRDGTLANGTWEAQWDQSGTPLVPISLELDGSVAYANCGSAVALDDIPAGGQITVGTWVRMDTSVTTATIMSKGSVTFGGYSISYIAGSVVLFVDLLTTPVAATFVRNIADRMWHHIGFHYDDATQTGRICVDGVWGAANVGVGAYQTDAANNLTIGRQSTGLTWFWPGAIAEVSIWSDDHFGAGNLFIPPARMNPPAAGGTLVESWAFSDGAGTTLTATVTSPGNDGTITPGTGKWNVTTDLIVSSPGQGIYHDGYTIAVDAANEGITQVVTGLTPGDGYVVRIPITWDPDCYARPLIRIYDEIGAAAIVQFNAPLLTGLHTGGAVATLIVAGARFTQSMIGLTLDNITTNASAVVTAVSGDGTTVTAAVAGGWNLGDVFRFRWATWWPWAWVETFCFTLPAGCTSISMQVRNAYTQGIFYMHQAEELEALLTHGDVEAGVGNPYIPTNWANVGLAAGESAAEAAIIHAGAQSIRFAAAADGDGIRQQITAAIGDYIHVSLWSYGDGSAGFTIGGLDATQLLLQSSTTAFNIATPHTAVWSRTSAVFRVVAANPFIYILADAGAAGNRYIDDVSAFEDNAVSLTVTPASQPNSLESGGIRVDGWDRAFQPAPVTILTPTRGNIRFTWIPRHPDALAVSFGNISAWLLRVDGGANNFIDLVWNVANNLRLQFNANGAGIQIGNWATGGGAIVPGTPYAMRIAYSLNWMRLYVDEVPRITINAPTGFAWTDPMLAYWGSTDASIYQADSVYAVP